MDFYNSPIGFGLALSANTAAMNYYAHLPEEKKQEIDAFFDSIKTR